MPAISLTVKKNFQPSHAQTKARKVTPTKKEVRNANFTLASQRNSENLRDIKSAKRKIRE